MSDQAGVGAGWDAWEHGDPFEASNGMIFRARDFVPNDDERVRIGFLVAPKNCNFLGACHGGLLATLLDIAMGRNVLAATGAAGAPTISMTVDYVRGAAVGDWLESRARVVRCTRRIAFAEASIVGAAGVVARASGIFSLPAVPS